MGIEFVTEAIILGYKASQDVMSMYARFCTNSVNGGGGGGCNAVWHSKPFILISVMGTYLEIVRIGKTQDVSIGILHWFSFFFFVVQHKSLKNIEHILVFLLHLQLPLHIRTVMVLSPAGEALLILPENIFLLPWSTTEWAVHHSGWWLFWALLSKMFSGTECFNMWREKKINAINGILRCIRDCKLPHLSDVQELDACDTHRKSGAEAYLPVSYHLL